MLTSVKAYECYAVNFNKNKPHKNSKQGRWGGGVVEQALDPPL